MNILVYIDQNDGAIKKSSLETVLYASKTTEKFSGSVTAIAIGNISDDDLANLGHYGAEKVLHVSDSGLNDFDDQVYTKILAEAADKVGADMVVFSHNSSGKALAPRLSVRMQAGLVAGATELPHQTGDEIHVVKSVFSGKAKADYTFKTDKKIISLTPNTVPVRKLEGKDAATVEAFSPSVSGNDIKVKVISKEQLSDSIPLPEAELVVSGGRGLKGPENWGMIEELADVLGAATACSRPVSDVGWRPHHEHVGQTGITIRPNLYIAVGISGAIQHLAGVNNSKVIVVINTDPEAPFFKEANYGIVGDAFDVVPKLIEAAKELKAS